MLLRGSWGALGGGLGRVLQGSAGGETVFFVGLVDPGGVIEGSWEILGGFWAGPGGVLGGSWGALGGSAGCRGPKNRWSARPT